MEKYNLRSGSKENQSSDDELDVTVMENVDKTPPSQSFDRDLISVLVSSIDALKVSVQELRNNTAESQKEIRNIRSQVECMPSGFNDSSIEGRPMSVLGPASTPGQMPMSVLGPASAHGQMPSSAPHASTSVLGPASTPGQMPMSVLGPASAHGQMPSSAPHASASVLGPASTLGQMPMPMSVLGPASAHGQMSSSAPYTSATPGQMPMSVLGPAPAPAHGQMHSPIAQVSASVYESMPTPGQITASAPGYVQPCLVSSSIQPVQFSIPEPSNHISNATMVSQNESRLYDLPIFSGKTEEWPLFLASFRDTTDAFRYNNRHNLMRLQRCLVGPAKDSVESMLIYPDDIPKAMEELEFRFGRPDLLVRCQLSKIQQFPSISEAKVEQIISFSTKVRNVVAFLTSANCQQHLSNPSLLEQLVLKLPANRQFEWVRHAASIKPFPTIHDFSIWLSDLARVIGLMPLSSQAIIRASSQPQQIRRVMHADENSPRKELKCYQCGGDHKLGNCKDIHQSISIQERWDKVKSQQLCFSCLSKGHNSMNCRTKKPCGVNGCQRYHHPCLHEESANRDSARRLHSCRAAVGCSSQLFKILPVTLFGPNGKAEVFVMFDEGSAVSLLEERTANKLGLKGPSQRLSLQWYGQKITSEQSSKVNLEIEGHEKEHRFALKNIRTIRNLDLPVQSLRKLDFGHLKTVPIIDYKNAKPVMLLGLDYVHLGASSTIVQSDASLPIAVKTKLGWVAYGPTPASASPSSFSFHIREHRSLNELNQIVAEYFSTDNFGVNATSTILESEEDAAARKILETTTRRLDDGKNFETGLLWKKDVTELPDSYGMAQKRLVNIERRMQRDPEFAERYQREMTKYFEKSYARHLLPGELITTEPVWYLPHFAIQNPHKPDKLRIVFDAAATINDVSLNSMLLKGPEQAKPLINILLQFRQGIIGVAADICEMFSQIKIRATDQHAQRFLWRDSDCRQPIQQYVMTSMIFGAVCSPCSAEYVKNRNAEDYLQQFPEAATTVKEKHYVDDFVVSFSSEQEAERICRQVVDINAEAGFNLRSFISNSNFLETTLNGSSRQKGICITMERQASADKVLGMFWDTSTDTFRFQTKFHRIPQEVLQEVRAPTKRELLGIVMAVFDPYGLLADFLVFSKILVQHTWKYNLEWDDPIPSELHTKWIAWWREFQNVKEFMINRCYSPNLLVAVKLDLHIFVDASQVAFSAFGYFRIEFSNGVDVAFVMGKTRTAPQKLMSVPRLELQAAVLGVRLQKMICRNHEVKVDRVFLWSDSRTVLYWIHSTGRKYKPFVGHRVAEIITSTSPSQWRWVPTSQNTADAATRPKIPPKFEASSSWIRGPAFLNYEEKYWPTSQLEPPPEELEEEIKTCALFHLKASNDFIDFNRFSSYLKLKRMTAWVLRFRSLMKKQLSSNINPKGPLTAKDLDDAEKFLCQIVQNEVFHEEIDALKRLRRVLKGSSIYSLSPYLDEEGLLRVHGRMDEAFCLPFEARRPIVLPQRHRITELIVLYFHVKCHHQNTAVTINETRQKFWIPHIKAVLKSVRHNCQHCQIDRAKPIPPFMGQLPEDRVTPYVRPFTYTGVDLFGPFNVSIGRRREKRWDVIFTCLTIRVAHLELAENLSTDAFIICFRNFINRRGTPKRIRSDNGTNFIGAQRELKQSARLLDTDVINDEVTKHNIEWVFNCPLNPSSGGCWERLIQIVKRLLSKTLHETSPRVETLRSVLIEAENIINSRPLTHIPLSTEEDEPITPNHFLLGCVNSTQTPQPPGTEICLKKQWRIAQNLKDRLWKRWVIEYLPQLLQRPKWHDKTTPLRVNDLVIICDPSLPRSQWKKGRIIKVFPAKDGHVRVAEVKTTQGSMRRPVTKLAVLSVEGESRVDSRGEEC